ncbi:unnamed protein product [Triticum turgidum subsp. durum]|uniref:DUF6598 domain-containing protein n=1 Tax=Triticum turgidum subsp. durum TaxID=4567 RepID=A0A9R0YQX1_TRITD|nr:unnamed protein product [Triticum turgidum subsp. durum]
MGETEMDSMQMDAGSTSKDRAVGKRKKRVPRIGKKAEEPSVRKTVKETRRRPPPVYKVTLPVFEQHRFEFNKWWMQLWGDLIGSMENKTTIPSARFTDVASGMSSGCPVTTLQPFEVKISPKENSGLTWPLHVYGYVAARDLVDYKRNIIFERGRDNCQIITDGFPYLALTGPARAVVLDDPVYFEIDLKVKGIGQSEDQDLIFVADSFSNPQPLESALFNRAFTGKISTVELTFGQIIKSVEAAVSMKVVHGSWPDGFRGCFAAKTASINDFTIGLLVIGDNGLPRADDGTIKLQRHVVCAEIGQGDYLEVFVRAYGVGGQQLYDTIYFTPQERGRLKGALNVDTCEIEVTISWSLIMSF